MHCQQPGQQAEQQVDRLPDSPEAAEEAPLDHEQAEKHYCLLLRVRLPILLLHPPYSAPGIPSMNMATCCVRSSVLLELAVEPWQSAAVLAELAELAEVGAAAAVLAELPASCVQTNT